MSEKYKEQSNCELTSEEQHQEREDREPHDKSRSREHSSILQRNLNFKVNPKSVLPIQGTEDNIDTFITNFERLARVYQ